MKILCLRPYGRGSMRYEPGQEYEVTPRRGELLIKNRKARELKDESMQQEAERQKEINVAAIEEPPKDKMIHRVTKRLKIKRKSRK